MKPIFGSFAGFFRGLSKKGTAGVSERSIPAPDNSLRDAVTGLYTKPHLLKRLEELCARSDREQKSLSLILWDIDGFVRFNNEYGKNEGDKFLSRVGLTIRKALRVYDEAFRIGPDEFCALLSPADAAIGADVMKRVEESLAQNIFLNDPLYRNKTFSVSSGQVIYPGLVRGPDALLHEAFQSLYKNQHATA